MDTKIILWSRKRGTFKLANPKHEHRTERQSLVDSLSLSFLVYWTEINSFHAKLINFSLLIPSRTFSRLAKSYFICI